MPHHSSPATFVLWANKYNKAQTEKDSLKNIGFTVQFKTVQHAIGNIEYWTFRVEAILWTT